MSIEIKITTLGIAATNAYLIGDTESKEAILIDPVDKAEVLKKAADDSGWTIKLILATHSHFDHVLASKTLKELTGAPFWIHSEAVPMLENLPQSAKRFGLGDSHEAAKPDRLLTTAPETIEIGAIKLETLHTPGHAPGHLSFYMPEYKIVFSGDALFFGSVGRTDLPFSNHEQLLTSIREKLLTLDDDVQVLSGHGQATTIGFERENNPFL
jgi:hydroxyacylglutathione hydrolase